MNVTELARILKINPQELRDILPQVGFDIGQKAIKIDNNTAQKIIRLWPELMREYRKSKESTEVKTSTEEEQEQEKKVVEIPKFVSVREFSSLTQIPINKILTELMKNGIFASMNERIDFDTASIIGSDLNIDVKLKEEIENKADGKEQVTIGEVLKREKTGDLELRAPVIVIMGHVDHGKTKLLDAIRETNVVAGEAGGITQHIGAYQIVRKDKPITFIDTPGHEAFTAMRSRGAKVADIAILVVAADDGVKPQTIEAFRIIEAAKIPFIVAINKIDKESADINRVKQELSTQLNITPEEWGGKTVIAPVSAITKAGVEDLLDMILLTADVESENIRANKHSAASGTVIESHIDKGAGPVATMLIQNGTLHAGDQLCFGSNSYGKARALKDYKGENLSEAGPSTPVRILGLKILPKVGDMLEVGIGEVVKANRMKSQEGGFNGKTTGPEKLRDGSKKLNLIVKSDVLGSAEAVEESLEKINNEEVEAKILYKGLGNIGEGDIKRAEDGSAQIIGFNVKIQPQIEDLIREKNVTVKTFNIIYDLIKYVKDQMQEMLEPEIKVVETGRLKVAAVFRTEEKSQIVGGRVLSGKVEMGEFIEVDRDGQTIANGKLVKLQAGRQDVNLVDENQECGLQYEGRPVIQVGDILKFHKEEKILKKL